jgi:hypothetical protein
MLERRLLLRSGVKFALAALLLAAACTAGSPPPEGEQATSFVTQGDYSMQYWAKADVLVINDGATKIDPRNVIARLGILENGRLPDVHFGVVTANASDEGRLVGGRFLADALQFDLTRTNNYAGTFDKAALALLNAAPNATTPEPIASALSALDAATNPDFHRDNVGIAVVLIAPQDDAGTTPIADLADALRARGVTSIGALVDCDAATPRIDALLAQFPDRSARRTACDDDGAVMDLVRLNFKQTLEGRCLQEPIADVDPEQPGAQHDCTAVLRDPLTGDDRLFPECSATHTNDCWSVEDSDQSGCELHHGLGFHPWRYPFPARLVIECVVE